MSTPLGMVSHYELRRRLGAGGMGEVFLAHDTVLQRFVAIKLLLETDPSDSGAALRLRSEARAAAALDHPGICAIYEVGTDGSGRGFIAMQYVEGDTLATQLRQGPLRVPVVLDLVHGIAEALDVAHRRGVIHRDLKPQNVIVTPSGSPKLLDFGIAQAPSSLTQTMTAMTTAVQEPAGLAGTPSYMAPELLQGRPADARSDLFSIGVLLYECLTGTRPFAGTTPHEVWGRVLHVEPEAPSRINASVGEDVDAICLRLLAKEPNERFQSAAELCGALQVVINRPRTSSVLAPPAPKHRWGPIAAVTAGMALFALLAGGWWMTARTSLPAAPQAAAQWYTRGIDAVRQGVYVTGRRALEEAIRLHPDYALAHSRLAEVLSALDEERAAQAELIRVSMIVPDQTRLRRDDRLRLDAIRSMVLRDFEQAVAAYTELSSAHPSDAGALVDLGRAQEAAGMMSAARSSYERATTLDGQFAAGFLRLGSVLGDVGRLSDSLRAFDEAERLYSLTSNEEGRAEVLLQRGATLDAAGRFSDAAANAADARQVAQQSGLLAQEIRAGFLHGSALVGGGAFAEGEATVRTFVDRAINAGLQGIAADGLIDMAGTMMARGRTDESDATLGRATAIAQDRSLTRTEMRATTQRASLKQQTGQSREALALLGPPLDYFARTRHRRLEAVALTIAARANQAMRQYEHAAEQLGQVMAFAVETHNDELTAQARSSLATVAASRGQLPEALDHRMAAVRLRRALGDTETLPYDLANLAEVLIRLGRGAEASVILDELDSGIASGIGAFPTRARRVITLRALLAVTQGDYQAAQDHAARLALDGRRPDETGQLASTLQALAAATLGSRKDVPPLFEGLDELSPAGRELRLWRGTTLALAGNTRQAEAVVGALLSDGALTGGTEFEWRLAAIAGMVALRAGERESARRRAAESLAAFERLTSEWGSAARAYQERSDLSSMLRTARATAQPPTKD